jgi:acyl-CoA dehydrogenase
VSFSVETGLPFDHGKSIAAIRALARSEILGTGSTAERGRVDRQLVKRLGDSGLLARLFPGGPGRWGKVPAVDLCVMREALAMESTAAETALALQGLGAYPILLWGTPELKDAWVAEVAAGNAVTAFALSEPDAGSDVAALGLAARPDGDGYRLTGIKKWISNAPDADIYTVFARTTEGAGARGVTAFAVPGDSPGLSGKALDMIVPHALGELSFDEVFVPEQAVLGEIDRGFSVAMSTLDLFRPSVGAFVVGMAQSALDLATSHARERHAFGRPLSEFQAISHRLADMATRTQAARLLVYHAAASYDAGGDGVTAAAAMAKLFATETAQFVVDAAVQIHGARALEAGHPLEHLYREVRPPLIYEGTSEIQRTIIARELLEGRG